MSDRKEQNYEQETEGQLKPNMDPTGEIEECGTPPEGDEE
jgi:hypothetical protein